MILLKSSEINRLNK